MVDDVLVVDAGTLVVVVVVEVVVGTVVVVVGGTVVVELVDVDVVDGSGVSERRSVRLLNDSGLPAQSLSV